MGLRTVIGACDQGCEHLTQILECGARAIALVGGILTRFLKGETERIKGYSSHEIIGSISVAFFRRGSRGRCILELPLA